MARLSFTSRAFPLVSALVVLLALDAAASANTSDKEQQEYQAELQGQENDDDYDLDARWLAVGRDRRAAASSPMIVACPRQAPRAPNSNMRAAMWLHVLRNERPLRINQLAGEPGWSTDSIDWLVEGGQFNTSAPTLMYTHGWSQSGSVHWLKNIRADYDKMFRRSSSGTFNLLIFDWGPYANLRAARSLIASYGSSVAYVPYLGELVGSFFERLRDQHKYNMSLVHLVTYSLSTHIGGVAGRRLARGGSPIGQITALDPTGVCFHKMPGGDNNNEDLKFGAEHGLRPTDAQLVLARHYNMFNLGARRLIGGLDIVMNDGETQPVMVRALASAMSHFRASLHEAEPFARKSDCHEMAYACANRAAYLAGQCAECGERDQSCYMLTTLARIQVRNQTAQPADTNVTAPTKMYINTGRSRFCVYAYQVLARLRADAPREATQAMRTGKLALVLADGTQLKPRNYWRAGSFTQLVEVNAKLADFRREITLKSNSNFKLEWLERLEINYMSHSSAQVRADSSAAYCPSDNALQKCT